MYRNRNSTTVSLNETCIIWFTAASHSVDPGSKNDKIVVLLGFLVFVYKCKTNPGDPKSLQITLFTLYIKFITVTLWEQVIWSSRVLSRVTAGVNLPSIVINIGSHNLWIYDNGINLNSTLFNRGESNFIYWVPAS